MRKKIFFGRQAQINILNKRIKDLAAGYRQNIAIIGDELIGKTSLILSCLDKLCDNRIIIIYLEIRPETTEAFAKRFIGALLYNFLTKSGIELKEDLNFLILKSDKYIPKTIERIKLILDALSKRKKSEVFTQLLSLCELIKEETNKSCVVIFDEFHNLENIGIKNIYREWSKLLISNKNTLYIITSSLQNKAKTILAKNLTLLFGNFETINIEPFDIATSEEYLKLRLGKLNIKPWIAKFIIHFTGGCPFYLDVICDSLLREDNVGILDIIERLMLDTSGILNQRFSNYLKRFSESTNSREYVSILYLISSGHTKIKDIAHLMHKTNKELNLRISQLLELDAISRSADFLKVNDRVFSFWLRFVYQEKLNSLTFDERNQQKLFRERLEREIKEFNLTNERSIGERIAELLKLFEDDLVQIEKKKMRLNRFREIKLLEFNNGFIKNGLIGRSTDSLWIMGFKHDALTEEDIAGFAKECKRYRHKMQRKIIVTLKGVDTNARLRALDEKILTWDVNHLNQILDLFAKPSVIA